MIGFFGLMEYYSYIYINKEIMFNKKAFKYTFYLSPEDLSNYLMDNLDDHELDFLFDIHTSNNPHMEREEENSTINYIYADIDDITRVNNILNAYNIEFKFEDVTKSVFTNSSSIPLLFHVLMMTYMKKYFSVDDMLDKIFKYGVTDSDKVIMEQFSK